MTTLSELKQFLPIPTVPLDKLGTKVKIGIVLSAIALLFMTGLIFLHPSSSKLTDAKIRNLIVSGVRNVSELTTAETTIKATIVLKEEAKILGLVPTGQTNLVYEGVGVVQAGINTYDIELVDEDLLQDKVHLILPEPHISSVNLDVDRSSTLANYRKWFGSKAGPELYDQAQRKVMAQIRTEACANEILETANANAVEHIQDIFAKANIEGVVIDTQLPTNGSCPGI